MRVFAIRMNVQLTLPIGRVALDSPSCRGLRRAEVLGDCLFPSERSCSRDVRATQDLSSPPRSFEAGVD